MQPGSHFVTVVHSSDYGLSLSYTLIQFHSEGFPSGAWDIPPSVPYVLAKM